jgi:hypothetical protein
VGCEYTEDIVGLREYWDEKGGLEVTDEYCEDVGGY